MTRLCGLSKFFKKRLPRAHQLANSLVPAGGGRSGVERGEERHSARESLPSKCRCASRPPPPTAP